MIVDGVEAREVIGYPHYAVTRDGRVWFAPSTPGKPGRPRVGGFRRLKETSGGYREVQLWRNGSYNSKLVHRLVLEAFVGPCPAGMEACHNNGVRADNRVENLRWDTRSANQQDRKSHGTALLGESNKNSKLTERDARMIVYMSRTGIFMQKEIAEFYGVSRDLIGKVVNKKMWKHIWKG